MATATETIVVRIGMMGLTEEGIGTASLVLDPGMSQGAIESSIKNAFSTATMQAITQFGQPMMKHVVAQMKGGE